VFKAPADADTGKDYELHPAAPLTLSLQSVMLYVCSQLPRSRRRRRVRRANRARAPGQDKTPQDEEEEGLPGEPLPQRPLQVPVRTAVQAHHDFLQEYLQNKFKKTDQRVGQLENHSAAICQVYREQDLTKDLGMEHFMRKVEAAHCAACDVFIPMQPHLIQKHIKSPDHNYNRKGMMEQSKRASLSVLRDVTRMLPTEKEGAGQLSNLSAAHRASDVIARRQTDGTVCSGFGARKVC
ncbi:hypothetical protein KUCAC02_029703, partial [Chaenocephalus aceratus]